MRKSRDLVGEKCINREHRKTGFSRCGLVKDSNTLPVSVLNQERAQCRAITVPASCPINTTESSLGMYVAKRLESEPQSYLHSNSFRLYRFVFSRTSTMPGTTYVKKTCQCEQSFLFLHT